MFEMTRYTAAGEVGERSRYAMCYQSSTICLPRFLPPLLPSLSRAVSSLTPSLFRSVSHPSTAREAARPEEREISGASHRPDQRPH